MVSKGDPSKPRPATSPDRREVTGEQPVIPRIDLSEAYAAVRRRGKALRRRRIISGVLAAVVLAGVFSVVGVYYISSIPLPDALSLPATTTVYYSDGTTVMARLGSQNRVIVDVDTLPKYVSEAIIAAEDPGYWFDSATLISRQYARVATNIDTSGTAGEARLLVVSWKLQDSYSKAQILGFYLNTVYFGRGAYGIEAAAAAYFAKHAADLTVAEAVVLAGLIASPGDGRFDPTVSPGPATQRFAEIAEQMLASGSIDRATAASLRVPRVNAYDPSLLESDLDRPTGLVVAQVLAELRETNAFRGKAPGYIENGGYTIVTTVDVRAQLLLEQVADDTVQGSLMDGQPGNLQAAAVVVEPGTGRVIAYFGGHDGTGADYAGWYYAASGKAAGFGSHPPGQTMDVYAMAAALKAGISVRSTWDAPESKEFPASGRLAANPVRDFVGAPCRPVCSLADAAVGSLNVPFYALTEKVGVPAVIDLAHAVGVDSMWLPDSADQPRQRFDLREQSGTALSPRPFGTDIAIGEYPVTVLDQANAMATFANGGVRERTHFVKRVSKDFVATYVEKLGSGTRVLNQAQVDDLSWALSQNPSGQLPDGRASASKTGVGLLRTSLVETAHAWIVGYTTDLAMAVWIGNEETEFPLKDKQGARVTGSGLPADIYRAFLTGASERLALPKKAFNQPTFTGSSEAGDAHSPRQ
jgi:membrane peptidoglycan carboxypeptidase